MAVYKRGYRRYDGPLTGRWLRFMVLPRHAWRRLYEQRLVVLLTLLPRGIALAIHVTINFVLTWGWHVWFETRKQGRTPGKRAMKIRVIDARGLPVSLYQSLVRNITRMTVSPRGDALAFVAADKTP